MFHILRANGVSISPHESFSAFRILQKYFEILNLSDFFVCLFVLAKYVNVSKCFCSHQLRYTVKDILHRMPKNCELSPIDEKVNVL